jgi:hypothetical protein
VDTPQAWFRSINSTFATSCVTRSLRKFQWAVSKLLATVVDTIEPLCGDPAAVTDPYPELQNIMLHSYGLSTAQRTARWLDHPSLGSNKSSILMD